jgi:hypothetical protein
MNLQVFDTRDRDDDQITVSLDRKLVRLQRLMHPRSHHREFFRLLRKGNGQLAAIDESE